MARLALVRKRREDAERQKEEEEGEGRGEAAKERMEKATKAKGASGPQKLNPLEVRSRAVPKPRPLVDTSKKYGVFFCLP